MSSAAASVRALREHVRGVGEGAAVVTAISLLFLTYTAVVAPVQVCLIEVDDPCYLYPTICMDAIVDSFFLMEVFLHFFVGVKVAGVYHDELNVIAFEYLVYPHRFLFDALTSIPFSYIDLSLHQGCDMRDSTENSSQVANARALRIVKVLRVLKLLRVLKFTKALVMLSDYLIYYLGSAVYKILRLLVVVVLVVHFFACAYWKVKVFSAFDPADVDAFLEARDIVPGDLVQIYLLCVYFTMTVFVTVGFGDIYAVTGSERVFCVFLFLMGASLFATLISQLNEIIEDSSHTTKLLESRIDAFLSIKPSLDSEKMRKVFQWVKFQFDAEMEDAQNKQVLMQESLPATLRFEVAHKVENNLFSKVMFLKGMDTISDITSLFAAQLVLLSEQRYFAENVVIADAHEDADGLMVITSGQVSVELPLDSHESDKITDMSQMILCVLGRGDSIGDNVIIGDKRWGGSLGMRADFIAKTNCSVAFIKTEDIQKLLNKFEFLSISCKVNLARKNALRYLERWNNPRLEHNSVGEEKMATLEQKETFFWIQIARHSLIETTKKELEKAKEDTQLSWVQWLSLQFGIQASKEASAASKQVPNLPKQTWMKACAAFALFNPRLLPRPKKGAFKTVLEEVEKDEQVKAEAKELFNRHAGPDNLLSFESLERVAVELFKAAHSGAMEKTESSEVRDRRRKWLRVFWITDTTSEHRNTTNGAEQANLTLLSLASFEEFYIIYKVTLRIKPSKLSPNQQMQITAALELSDKDGSGVLTEKQFRCAARRLGLPKQDVVIMAEDRAELFQPGGQKIIFKQAQTLLTRLDVLWRFGRQAEGVRSERVRAAFALFDTDDTKTLSRQELIAGLFALGFNRAGVVREVDRLIEQFDADGSEEFNGDEFEALMTNVALTGSGLLYDAWCVFDHLHREGSCSGGGKDEAMMTTFKHKVLNRDALDFALSEAGLVLEEGEKDKMLGYFPGKIGRPGEISFHDLYHIMSHTAWF